MILREQELCNDDDDDGNGNRDDDDDDDDLRREASAAFLHKLVRKRRYRVSYEISYTYIPTDKGQGTPRGGRSLQLL